VDSDGIVVSVEESREKIHVGDKILKVATGLDKEYEEDLPLILKTVNEGLVPFKVKFSIDKVQNFCYLLSKSTVSKIFDSSTHFTLHFCRVNSTTIRCIQGSCEFFLHAPGSFLHVSTFRYFKVIFLLFLGEKEGEALAPTKSRQR